MSQQGTLRKPIDRTEFVSRLLAMCEEATRQSSLGEEFGNFIEYLRELGRGEKQPDGVVGKLIVLEEDDNYQCWLVVPDKVSNNVVSGIPAYLSVKGVSEGIKKKLCEEFGLDEFCPVTDGCHCGEALVKKVQGVGDILTGKLIKGEVVDIF